MPSSLKKGSLYGWSLAASAVFIILYTRDGGTLPDQVSGLRVREPDSYPYCVARSDVPELARKLEGRTVAAQNLNILKLIQYEEKTGLNWLRIGSIKQSISYSSD
jgi:hypothetical protein